MTIAEIKSTINARGSINRADIALAKEVIGSSETLRQDLIDVVNDTSVSSDEKTEVIQDIDSYL